MNSTGLALINIDEAPIDLKELKLKQFFCQTDDIKNIVLDHYS
jgi:hypothetical protein